MRCAHCGEPHPQDPGGRHALRAKLADLHAAAIQEDEPETLRQLILATADPGPTLPTDAR